MWNAMDELLLKEPLGRPERIHKAPVTRCMHQHYVNGSVLVQTKHKVSGGKHLIISLA